MEEKTLEGLKELVETMDENTMVIVDLWKEGEADE